MHSFSHRPAEALLAGFLVSSPALVAAATLHVEKWGADAGNLACAATTPCASIAHAVGVAGDGDTIRVGSGQFGQMDETLIDKDLAIEGAGVFRTRIVGASQWSPSGIFRIAAGATVRIASLQIREGVADHGAAVFNAGSLELEDVWLRNNRSTFGAIYNTGSLVLRQVEIALTEGRALQNGPEGTTVLIRSRVAANDYGVANDRGVVIVRDALFVGNGRNIGATSFAMAAGPAGGAIALVNVTVSDNDGTAVSAGGATAELTHVTITDNAVGLQANDGATVALWNTIVSENNSTVNCQTAGANVGGVGNLLAETSCLSFPTPDNIYGVPPELGPLAPNDGGALWTHAPDPGSPVIDAAVAEMCVTPDQRGVSRPRDGDGDGTPRCDIGAHEFIAPGPERGRGGRSGGRR
jgi:hypothetical protein